jgi:hypothetical protein
MPKKRGICANFRPRDSAAAQKRNGNLKLVFSPSAAGRLLLSSSGPDHYSHQSICVKILHPYADNLAAVSHRMSVHFPEVCPCP